MTKTATTGRITLTDFQANYAAALVEQTFARRGMTGAIRYAARKIRAEFYAGMDLDGSVQLSLECAIARSLAD